MSALLPKAGITAQQLRLAPTFVRSSSNRDQSEAQLMVALKVTIEQPLPLGEAIQILTA